MLPTFYTCKSKLRRLIKVIINNFLHKLYINPLLQIWYSLCFSTRLECTGQNSLWEGEPCCEQLSRWSPSLICYRSWKLSMYWGRSFQEIKYNTAEWWSALGPSKAHSSSDTVFQSSHIASARFLVLSIFILPTLRPLSDVPIILHLEIQSKSFRARIWTYVVHNVLLKITQF